AADPPRVLSGDAVLRRILHEIGGVSRPDRGVVHRTFSECPATHGFNTTGRTWTAHHDPPVVVPASGPRAPRLTAIRSGAQRGARGSKGYFLSLPSTSPDRAAMNASWGTST